MQEIHDDCENHVGGCPLAYKVWLIKGTTAQDIRGWQELRE